LGSHFGSDEEESVSELAGGLAGGGVSGTGGGTGEGAGESELTVENGEKAELGLRTRSDKEESVSELGDSGDEALLNVIDGGESEPHPGVCNSSSGCCDCVIEGKSDLESSGSGGNSSALGCRERISEFGSGILQF
jgi:hypothetical protein